MNRKKEMRAALRKLAHAVPSADEMTASEYLCADGKAQIDVLLRPDSELYDPLTWGRQLDLSNAIYDLINGKLATIPLKYPIRVCFHGAVPEAEEQQQVRDMIYEHYRYALRDKREDLRLNLIKTVLMALLGVGLLSLYFVLELTVANPVFMEFLSIAGWVAAWEAVDCWVLERRKLHVDYWCAGRAVLCEVTFEETPQDLRKM